VLRRAEPLRRAAPVRGLADLAVDLLAAVRGLADLVDFEADLLAVVFFAAVRGLADLADLLAVVFLAAVRGFADFAAAVCEVFRDAVFFRAVEAVPVDLRAEGLVLAMSTPSAVSARCQLGYTSRQASESRGLEIISENPTAVFWHPEHLLRFGLRDL
jgi:hypothetical protein